MTILQPMTPSFSLRCGGNLCTHADELPDGLSVTVHTRAFDDFPALEWFLEIANTSQANSPVLERILPLDVTWPTTRAEIIQLHRARGCECRMDDFLPVSDRIIPRTSVALAPIGGRSSKGAWPFLNLQRDGGGFVLAIGWSGQWAATFDRSDTSDTTFRVTAGMERTRLYLKPGETIRTPRILWIEWAGNDPSAGNNLLRQVLLRHYCPRVDGRLAMPVTAHNTFATYSTANVMTEAGEFEALARAAELGCEAYWVDAGWHGVGGQWWEEVGNWFVNRQRFPRGITPVSDAAHRAGMRFVLWFEIERVRVGTQLETEHPEFLLRCRATNYHTFYGLYNLGSADARAYLADLLSTAITEHGMDVYRQDFNMDPLPYWQAADEPDRIGITEIRYIEGLYALWDELRRRHPGLVIDGCASGGLRLDLETLSRSIPLWRDDFPYMGGQTFGRGLQVGDQCASVGLSRWIPFHSGAVWTFSPYDLRSALAAGMLIFSDVRTKEFPSEDARLAVAEVKRLRPFFLGNLHLLVPVSVSYADWCAYQCHRPDLGAGFAVFLRRHESPYPTMEVSLRELDPGKQYEAWFRSGFENPTRALLTGSALADRTVTIPDRPGSLLIEYRPV